MLKYSSRFWLYAPTGFFLLLAATVMIHWWSAADGFEKKLAALKGREAVPGVTLNWDKVEVGGFPFRMDSSFQNLRIAGAGAHGPFSWRSEKFAMHGLTYGRSQDVYEAAGQQQVSWTDASGQNHAASFLPGSMRGSSILDAQGLRRFDLDIVQIGGADFTLARLQFHMRRDPDGNSLDLMISIDSLPAGKPAHLQLYVTLPKAKALMSLLQGDIAWPEATKRWRSQGGTEKLSNGPAADQALGKFLKPLY